VPIVKAGQLLDNTRVDFDIIIIGAGLTGLSLAAALKRSRLSVALVEGRASAQPSDLGTGWDTRIYAISPTNARFLTTIGIWGHLDAARIEPVRAMEVYGDADGRLDFSASDAGLGELAWILEASLMQRELWETVKRQGNVALFCPNVPQAAGFTGNAVTLTLADGRALRGRLVVAADGADSWTRKAAGIEVQFKQYKQHGVVANFEIGRPHCGIACQWFRADGILAWLPLPGNLISLVWSTSADHAAELLALPPEDFCQCVASAGHHRLGDLSLVTPPAAFPLRLMRAPRMTAPRLALIGDAAHVIHPLSGHGINLGFQDAHALAETLLAKPEHVDCGDLHFLRRFERVRKEEIIMLQTVTDGLHKLFGMSGQPVARLRNFGLNFIHHLPVVKDLLVRYATG
jgi:ubiquinone biosynthesis UbiH/UbiF/VisC/COQ6 family hydroxylase